MYAVGVGYELAVGVTSPGNVGRTEALGLYTQVVTYDAMTDIDASKPAVIVDMSGNGNVLAALHTHLGDNMRFNSNVGLTHYDENEMAEGFIAERSKMFFAPGHIQKRAQDWGPGVFDQRAYGFWRDASIKSAEWLSYDHRSGMQSLESSWHEVLGGGAPTDVGIIIKP